MRQEKLNFSIILRVAISLLPILFGLSLPAMVWCAFNIAMSFLVFGPITSLISSLSAICISMLFFGFYGEGAKLQGLLLALESVFCAAASVYTVVKRKDFYSGVWLCGLGFLVPSFIGLKYDATRAGVSIASYLTDAPIAMLKQQFDLALEQAGASFNGAIIEQIIDAVYKVTIMVIPSVFVLVSALIGYGVMWCVCARLRLLPIRVEHSFSTVKIPKTMVLVMIVAFIIYALQLNDTLNYVSLNIAVILFYVSSFAGLAMLDYFLRKVIKNGFSRIVMYIFLVMSFSAVIVAVLAIAAIIDSFFDFRKIGKRRKSCETEG